jgi:hypothetical protein
VRCQPRRYLGDEPAIGTDRRTSHPGHGSDRAALSESRVARGGETDLSTLSIVENPLIARLQGRVNRSKEYEYPAEHADDALAQAKKGQGIQADLISGKECVQLSFTGEFRLESPGRETS